VALRHRPFRRAARPVRRLSALEVVITLTDIPTEPRSAVVTARGTRVLVVFALLTGAVVGLGAQGNAQCNAYAAGPFGNSREANVCNAGVDGASVFAPVAGILIAGGNPFLGATGGLGGFPHLGLTLRANATSVVIPDFSYNGVGTTVAAKQTILAPAPLIEAALGVFRGLRHGNLALDVLGSAQLLPTTLIDDVHIDVNARRIGSIALGLGVGARVTLLGERQAVPAVTVSLMRRTLPRIGVGNIVGGDSYEFASDLASTEYRATVGKRIGPLDLGAGVGWSDFTAAAEIVFVNPVTRATEPPVSLNIKDSRALVFVDGGLAFGSVYLIAEAGSQRGRDLGLVTTFMGNDPAASRIFGSIGLRFGF
jgi:hypothetical protein